LRSWRCDWQAAPGRVFGSYQCQESDKELERRQVTLGAAPVALEMTPSAPGTLLVSLRAPDGRGHEAVASDEIWAVGNGEVSWKLDSNARVPLIAGKQRYKPGETARLVA